MNHLAAGQMVFFVRKRYEFLLEALAGTEKTKPKI